MQRSLFKEIDISRLESHLWEAANILRGSPVDRTDWKSYILPLLFFKRICDVWDEEYQESVETFGELSICKAFEMVTGKGGRNSIFPSILSMFVITLSPLRPRTLYIFPRFPGSP